MTGQTPRTLRRTRVLLPATALIILGIGGMSARAESGPSPAPSGSQLFDAIQLTSESTTLRGPLKLDGIAPLAPARNRAAGESASTGGRASRGWPLRAQPDSWPRLFSNTTECTLSFDPITRRHWWQ